MKYSTHRFSFSTYYCFGLIIVLMVIFSSCDSSKKIGKNGNNGNSKLDPVVGENTNPKDTSTTGDYTPITNVGENETKVDTISWCDTISVNPSKQIVICYQKIGDQAITKDTVNVTELNPNALYIAENIDSTIKRKLAYRVAIMMPFMSANFIPTPTREIPSRSVKAVEFYEGVLIALDSLKKEGVNLFVDVYDTQRDSATVAGLLTKREVREADLIIGPITSSNLQLVAEFAKEHSKPLISPFNSRDDLTTNNPYYIQVNPSYQVESACIIEQLHKIEQDYSIIRQKMEKNILILALDEDSTRAAMLQENYAIYKNDTAAKIPTLLRPTATIDIEEIQPKLQKDKLNIILMPTSRNEGFVYNSLREIQKLVDKVEPRMGYQIAVIGMDRWKYYTRINFEYYESLNLYLASQFFLDESQDDVKSFRADYKSLYGIGAREFGFIGFDVMLYFGRMIQEYGVNFQAHLWKAPQQYRHTKFRIEPSYDIVEPIEGDPEGMKRAVIRGYENKYIHFLKFDNYSLEVTNDK